MVHETSDTLQVQDRLELRIKVEKGDCYWVGGRSKLYPIRNPHSTGIPDFLRAGLTARKMRFLGRWDWEIARAWSWDFWTKIPRSPVFERWQAAYLFPYISPIEQGIENIEIINHIELES